MKYRNRLGFEVCLPLEALLLEKLENFSKCTLSLAAVAPFCILKSSSRTSSGVLFYFERYWLRMLAFSAATLSFYLSLICCV